MSCDLRPATEKITINLGYVDLGHIDLMVQEGFYSNRTDFIRTAIRNQLERHADAVKRSVAHKSLDLGLRHYAARTSKRCVQPARPSTFMFWALPASPMMSRPSLPAPRSSRSSCWEPCAPALRSRPHWPTGSGDRGAFAPPSRS
jgi:Arc/MetJ-type ribon-helix-helix transcriptional regulator